MVKTELASHSRRVLVGAPVALAMAPLAAARKRRKRKKKKKTLDVPPPLPPLATALMTVSSVKVLGDSFACGTVGSWKHLASGESADVTVSLFVPMEITGDAVRAFIVTALQGAISIELANNAFDVAPERIAVTVI